MVLMPILVGLNESLPPKLKHNTTSQTDTIWTTKLEETDGSLHSNTERFTESKL